MKEIVYIPVAHLHPHPDNPRKDLGDLTELAESIKAKGVLQNLTVVPYYSPVHERIISGLYTIVIGHRRHAAAELAGVTELPCVITDMTPQEQFETMMVENVQRSDLTVYEQAEGFQMMLDMGGTVDEVARKTGFSATTVRNRVQLLKLDKKKLHKAETRGGTMTDYIKLNAIQDPVRRNKVLDTIGTPDFDNALKRHIENEKLESFMAGIRADIKAADWCRQRENENCSVDGEYAYYRSFGKYNQGELQRPEDADTVDYIWVDHGSDVTIYRKKDPEKITADDAAKERKTRAKAAMEAIIAELQSISSTHLELRGDFIHGFTAINTHEMDIEAFAAKAILFVCDPKNCHRVRLDLDSLGTLVGVKVNHEPTLHDSFDQAGWNSQLFYRPLYALLCTVYTMLENSGHKYFCNYWVDPDIGSMPRHNRVPILNLIYEGLVSMGYEMSEEEIQMKNGTHPLFQKAQKLIDDYKKEVEANG